MLAGAACLLVRAFAGRDAIYQLIPWVRLWDMGEPSLTRSLAAPRAAHPYPPDRLLNAAGNRVIGLSAGWGRLSNENRCGGLATRAAIGFGAGSSGRIRKPGSPSARPDCRPSGFCNPNEAGRRTAHADCHARRAQRASAASRIRSCRQLLRDAGPACQGRGKHTRARSSQSACASLRCAFAR